MATAGRRRFYGGGFRGPGVMAAFAVLAAAPLVLAAPPGSPPTPAPQPTTFFGIPVPTALPFPVPPAAAPTPSTFLGFPVPQLPYWSPQQVLVLPPSADPINMQALAQLLANPAQGCGTKEMAPGEYVKLDCHPYAAVQSAGNEVFDPAKLMLLAQGLLHMTPETPVAPPSNGSNTHEGLPVTVDHRALHFEGPVKDQGLVGDCSAFSLSSVIDNAILRMHKADVVSPEHIWAHYGSSDMGSAGDSNVNKPITLNQVWPYSAKQACEIERDPNDECGRLLGVQPASASKDAALQAQYHHAEGAGAYRITKIDRITQEPNINVDAIVAVLATGADVWCGFNVDATAWKSTSQQNNVVRDWGGTNAGHAVALAGYRQAPGGTGRQFLVHNSWGGSWGDHGFAWVNESMVRQHMQVAYRVTVVDPGGPKPGVQTDDQCGAGALVDSATSQCAPACPNGSRRAGGQCTVKR